MTPRERIERLTAILGVSPAVTLTKYRGGGERTTRRGWIAAAVEGYATEGPDEATALLCLANGLEGLVESRARTAARGMVSANERAARRRAYAERLRADAAAEDQAANDLEAEATRQLDAARGAIDALAAYRAERGEVGDE